MSFHYISKFEVAGDPHSVWSTLGEKKNKGVVKKGIPYQVGGGEG